MRSLVLTIFAVLLAASARAQTTDLIISEYVEGSGTNKALEIHNGTGNDIDLGIYSLVFYFNGATDGTAIALDAVTLAEGGTHVLADNDADAALLALADQLYSGSFFNGNDAIVLERDGVVIDSIGTVGVDPGTAWSCVAGSAQNHTLRRMVSICNGDDNPDDLFDLCAEWEILPSDTFDGLGEHLSDCYSVGADGNVLGEIKALYR